MDFEQDTIQTSSGELTITFLGHGSLYFGFTGKTIHVDPYGEVADYSGLPKADLVLLTHDHYDHLDMNAYNAILKEGTVTVANTSCKDKVQNGVILGNGETETVMGLTFEAVPAYNILHKRPDGNPFHPQGYGNGYIVTLGDKRIYIGGDTENIPEMSEIKDIDVAFLPMNLPYTMTPEMVTEAAKTIRPKILYPYHFGESDTSRLTELLSDEPDIEVRIRNMK